MYRKTILVLLICAFTVWSPLSSVLAADKTVAAKQAGHFMGAGAGHIHLKCKGHLTIESKGKGITLIRNVSGTKIKIQGAGLKIPLPGLNAVLISGLKGRVDLVGDQINALYQGGFVSLRATGHGSVWLKGEGFFKINDKPLHKWPDLIKKLHY